MHQMHGAKNNITLHTRDTAVRICNLIESPHDWYSSELLLNKMYYPGLSRDWVDVLEIAHFAFPWQEWQKGYGFVPWLNRERHGNVKALDFTCGGSFLFVSVPFNLIAFFFPCLHVVVKFTPTNGKYSLGRRSRGFISMCSYQKSRFFLTLHTVISIAIE